MGQEQHGDGRRLLLALDALSHPGVSPMQFLALTLAAAVLGFQCWLSFDPQARRSWWLYPGMVGSSAVTSALWAFAARWVDDTKRIYVLSVLWEATIVLVWYFVPIFFFDVDVRQWALIGVGLVVAGIGLIQLFSTN